MPSRKHPGSKSVGWALVQAARLHRGRIGDRLGALGLFAGQEGVLQALADGPMTMGELAGLLRVRPPTASKTVSRLSALGLVERRAEPGDARLVRVGLTAAGVDRAAAVEGLWDEVEAEMLAALDPKDRKRLRKLLRKAARSLAEAGGGDLRDLDDETDAAEEGADPLPAPARISEPA